MKIDHILNNLYAAQAVLERIQQEHPELGRVTYGNIDEALNFMAQLIDTCEHLDGNLNGLFTPGNLAAKIRQEEMQ